MSGRSRDTYIIREGEREEEREEEHLSNTKEGSEQTKKTCYTAQ